MNDEHAIQLAVKLMRLGVSRVGVADLLGHYPYDLIERQLTYLPYRKAKRPEAMIIEAIRNDYSPPNSFYYAPTQTAPSPTPPLLDQDPQPPPRSPDANPPRYGTQSAPGAVAPDNRLEPSGAECHVALPDLEDEDGEA